MPPQSFSELQERYQRGERNFTESELDAEPYGELSGVCLDGADFSRSFIVANFRGASLRGVSFRNGNVKTCDFRDADLCGADFRGAAIDAADFIGANLEGALFAGAGAYGYRFEEGEQPNTAEKPKPPAQVVLWSYGVGYFRRDGGDEVEESQT